MCDQPDLLLRLRELEEQALEQAYATFQPALYAYAYRLLGHRESAEDIVGETFHRLLHSLHNGRGPRRDLQSWLYRVAHNLIVDWYRRRDRGPTLPLDDQLSPSVEELEEQAQQQLTQQQVRQALWSLTPISSRSSCSSSFRV